MLSPLRATPLNTRANATKVPWPFPSCGPGSGVPLPAGCSSPAGNGRAVSAPQSARCRLGAAWRRKGRDRNSVRLAGFRKGPRAEAR